MKNIGFNTECDINIINRLAENEPEKFIAGCEKRYIDILAEVAKAVSGEKGRTIVLLAGPSGSGKTTSAHKIAENVKALGFDAVTISFDNFYKGRDSVPLLEDGRRDYETIYALDVPVVQQCLKDIVEQGRCLMPEFDFNAGVPKKEKTEVSLGDDGVVILEGIHALNPIIVDALEKISRGRIFKLFVSVGEGMYDGDKEIISARELRLMRRMTRDFTHRSSSPGNTLRLWTNVVAGEMKYLEPYADTADFNINSLHSYEPCVFKENIEPLLEGVKPGEENYGAAYRLFSFLHRVKRIPEEYIPDKSLLNEFIVIESKLGKDKK